ATAFTATLQVGANNGQSMTISIQNMSAEALGIAGEAGTDDGSGNITGGGHQLGASVDELLDGRTAVTDARYTEEVVTDGTSTSVQSGALDVSSHETATAAIEAINDAIETVSAQRSNLGSFQNRLEHTISNLNNSSENLSAAESRIRDVDMAKEMMEMTRANILSQASQSMLVQANQQPQSVLQL